MTVRAKPAAFETSDRREVWADVVPWWLDYRNGYELVMALEIGRGPES